MSNKKNLNINVNESLIDDDKVVSSLEKNSNKLYDEKDIKNIYLTAHGKRIKNSYFKLERNVNVYMKCSDTISYSNILTKSIMMKFLINNVNIKDLDKMIKNFNEKKIFKSLKSFITSNKTHLDNIQLIEEIKNRVRNNLIKNINLYKKKIDKLDNLYNKVNKKNVDGKYDDILENIKKSIQKILIIIIKIEDIIINVLDVNNYNFEKLKNIYKSEYNRLEKYRKKKEKFEKNIDKMNKRYKDYDPFFDLCVFSGNLDHTIRKYTHGKICSMKKLDLNICPNIMFDADNAKLFRDFISEQGIHIEIKKDEKTYMTHENIINEIDNYIRMIQSKGNNLIYDNIGFNMVCDRDVIYFKKNIETKILESKKNIVINETILDFYKYNIKYGLSKKTRKMAKLMKLKTISFIKKMNKEIIKMKGYVKGNYRMDIDDDNGNKLFYPIGDWSDCNIKKKIYDVLYEYLNNSKNVNKKFRYYDVVKRRFLSDDECMRKYKKEYKSNKDYKYFTLRDILLYLHERYKMDENRNMRIELIISACKSEFDIIKDVYGTCKLSLSDYLYKKLNVNGKMSTLRAYDLRRTNMVIPNMDSKRVRRSCSTILKKDGCPSYCEMPKDKARKTCIIKSRRRKMREKRKFVVEKAVSGKS